MLAHVPSFGRNPRGSPDFLAYPVPKACMHVLGTRVPRRLGVARSASSPKAALALGCRLTPGLRISFGRVTCMARAASVPTVGLRWWLGPGCGWSWVLFSPARRGWGLGCVCLGSVCGVVPLLLAVCRVPGWALVSARFRDVCGFVRVSLAPRRFRFRCAVWACVLGPGPGWALPFLTGLSGCVLCAFFFFSFFFSGCWVSPSRALWYLPPSPFFSAGLLAFFFCLLVSVPLFPVGRCSWLGVAGFCWVVPLCLFGGPVFGALWVGGLASSCVFGGRFGGCGPFSRGPPFPAPPFFLGGGGGGGRPGCSSLCLPSAGACSVAGVWCGWSLATPGGGSCVLLPATPGWVSLPVVVGGPRHSWLGSAGGGGVWCVVCGGGVLVGLWLVCGVVGASPLLAEVPVCYSPPLLAGFRCRWWWAVPATPGWGPLAALLCGVWCVAVVCWWGCGWCVVWLVPRHSWRRFLCATPRHSWLGFAAGGGGRSPPLLAGVRLRRWCVVCGVWCVVCGGGVLVGLGLVCGVWCVVVVCCWGCGWCVACGGGVLLGLWLVCGVVGPSPLPAEVPVCYSPPLLAGFRCRWWWVVPATPGWGPLAAVVCGVWCVVCWWGPSPLLAEVPVCYSPPLLPGFRWRRWCVVCGVWRWCVVGVVVGVWCGWSLATPGGGPCVLLPATPGWVSLPVVVGGPRHSWLGSAGGGGVWCVVCGVWRWCVVGVVVGVWCGWSLATPGGGPCVLLPATPGWVSLPVVVGGPRHSWLGSVGGGGLWCVVCWWGPSPLLAEVPVCYSPPLLAGFRCRWWWAVPATPGWGPLAAVACGVCSCVCFAWPGRAGRPPGRVVVRLTFSFGRFVFLLCLAPSGPGLPLSLSLLLPFLAGCFSRPPAAWLSVRSRLVCVSRLAVGCSLVVGPPPPSPFVSRGFRRSCLVPWCFFFLSSFLFFLCAPPLSPVFSGFRPRVPWASALALFALFAFRFWALRALVALSCFPPGCWLLSRGCCPPPPSLCFAVCVPAARCCVPCAAVLPWVGCCAALLRVVSPGVLLSCAVLRSCGAAACCAVPFGAARRPGALCSAALCFAVFPRAVCSVLCVFCPGAVVRAVVRRSALCCVCRGVLCCAFPVLSVLCGAVLRCAGALVLCCSCGACCCWRLVLWCAAVCCAVSCGVPWCGAGSGGPWLSAGGVFVCRCPCLAAWSASLWLVWFAVVPCFPVSCSVVLCCRVVLCCCALLSCCGAVGACFALLWAVVLCCVVLLVGCAVFGPVLVSARCGAVFLALCVPCLLRSVRCGALLCWLWCPASLCRVLWRCAVVWCCAVVLCCRFAVLFVLALPSCGLSAAPVWSALLLVPRAVACPCALWCLPGRSAVWWCCSGVSWCLAVLCVVLWCPAPCAVSCGAVLPCGAVLFVFPFVLFSFAKNPCRFSVPLETL